MKLIRVVAPHFVAGFETDGIVRRAAPILRRLIGLTDDQARQIIARFGWKASVVPDPQIVQHEESFEVQWPGGRKFFYFDDNAGRRAVSGRKTSQAAYAAAHTFLNGLNSPNTPPPAPR